MSTRRITDHLPPFLLRLGSFIVLACFGIFAFLSWLLEYKDTVGGQITITTQLVPLEIHANSTGKLRLLQQDNAVVKKGDRLAYIENPTALEPCLSLMEELEVAKKVAQPLEAIPAILAKVEGENLGIIQPALLNLSKSYKHYQIFLKNDTHQEVVASKKRQILLQKEYMQLAESKINLYHQNIALTEEQLAIDKQLFEEDILSKRSLDQSTQTFNNLTLSGRLIDFQAAISSSKIKIAEQEEAILILKSTYLLEKEQLEKAVLNDFLLLQNALANWKETYLMEADLEGTLVYSDYLSNYEFIQQGAKTMTIVPTGNVQYLGLLQLPMAGFSKVKKDQPVHIRLDHYPYTEFGILTGQVAALSAIPNNNAYTVQVAFPEGLRSTYNIDFEFNQLMSGQAEVITNRMSLWQRVRNQMHSAQLNN